jgi:hypothetical protein
MTTNVRTLTSRQYLQHARMLVPKFSFMHNGSWHVHWPKDQPNVVHAETQEDLVIKLAVWLQSLGRVGNVGKHVDPEYP